jgi:hypothetical protein
MRIFPDTDTFHLHVHGHSFSLGEAQRVSTIHVSKSGFEDMMRDVAKHALMHAKLTGQQIAAFFGDSGDYCLVAYPQGYTEVYR